MERSALLQVKNLNIFLSGRCVLANVSFDIKEGECFAIVGTSGSGKTTLLNALARNHYYNKNIFFSNSHPVINIISQQHYFKNLSNTSTFYYQQRFNSFDAEDAQTVSNVLKDINNDVAKISEVLELLNIAYIKETTLIKLSNGEHKRFQIAKAILHNTDWLLLDSPYTGLDAAARALLDDILEKLILKGIHIILVASSNHIPEFISHVALLEDGHISKKMLRENFIKTQYNKQQKKAVIDMNLLSALTSAYAHEEFTTAIKMVDTNVVYDNRKILDSINWQVSKGECWSVSGHNGSGKSTLLSLITGDNPQAFANEIYLFDRKKGSGESIWDIKKKIGYMSPELHHYFDAAETCFNVIASGLFDTIGLFKILNEKQRSIVKDWMNLLHITEFENRFFKQLSNGEQRLVLLARALVKNPPLLILDEPCQGLDAEVSEAFVELINDICIKMKKTLVYVSHYEEEIPSCVNYTLKLEAGKIAA